MRTFTTLEDVAAAAGSEIGTSDWLQVDQARIDAFADATLDHQWIHVDVEAAGAGPFGTTIAHGFLTLSLLPHFASQVFRLDTPGARLNYGLEKVRFPKPGRYRFQLVAGGDAVDACSFFVGEVPAAGRS